MGRFFGSENFQKLEIGGYNKIKEPPNTDLYIGNE
jgi:hypothetical protein